MKVLPFISFLIVNITLSFGQLNIHQDADKCGAYPLEFKSFNGDSWGYSYDSLLNDISKWELSEFVEITSIGQSAQGREIYELTVTDFEINDANKERIYIHARTHPGEIQSFWVTDEIIKYLLSDNEIGNYLRERCVFHIVPMFNPDGVELEYPRENANNIDIESNWNNEYPEVEVINLRSRFGELMQNSTPIKIALNMHSAYACKRYFVYHHENGTSLAYANSEVTYIESTRSHFLEGIEPYSYYVSWVNGTPTQYPESWWWNNYGANVLALTYEDMNCSSAGFYDKTAFAMLHGISDYLGLGYVGFEDNFISSDLEIKAFPNPFNDYITIEWNNFETFDQAIITDIMGRNVRVFSKEESHGGSIFWDGADNFGNHVPPGSYFVTIIVNDQLKILKILKQ